MPICIMNTTYITIKQSPKKKKIEEKDSGLGEDHKSTQRSNKNDLKKSIVSELTGYKQALRSFRAQDWDKAEMDFFNLSRSHPDRLIYQVYLDRIAIYRQQPPGSDWDGVFTHTSK